MKRDILQKHCQKLTGNLCVVLRGANTKTWLVYFGYKEAPVIPYMKPVNKGIHRTDSTKCNRPLP